MRDLAEAWRLIEAGRYGEAEALLAQDPSPEARFALGYALFFAGRHEEALALYRDLYQRTGSHRVLHQVGMVLKGMGKLEEALGVFLEEARLLPEDPLARSVNLYEQGHVRLLLREKEASRECLEACLREAERAMDPLGLACAHRGLLEWHLRFQEPEGERHREEAIRYFLMAGDERGAKEVEGLA